MNKWLTGREQAVLMAFAGAIVLGAGALLLQNRDAPEPVVIEDAEPGHLIDIRPPDEAEIPAPASAEEPAQVAVAVAGAIESPGLYWFEAGARVQDALDEAGGTTQAADLGDLNLAARLVDGTTLTVPARPNEMGWRDPQFDPGRNPAAYRISGWTEAGPGGHAGSPAAPGGSGRINLNTASQDQLEALPGIGPVLAGRIAAGRPYAHVSDLQRVSGIGPKRFATLEPLVTAGP
jgi:competence protein ComEA